MDPPGIEIESWIEPSPRTPPCGVANTAPATLIHQVRNYSLINFWLRASSWCDGYEGPEPVLRFVPEDEPYSNIEFLLPARRARSRASDISSVKRVQSQMQPGLKEGDDPSKDEVLWIHWGYGTGQGQIIDWSQDFFLQVDVFP